MLEITAQMFVAFLGVELYRGFSRWFWDEDYKSRQESVFFTVIWFSIILISISTAVLYNFTSAISSILLNTPDHAYLIKLMLFSVGLDIFARIPQTHMRLEERAVFFTIMSILKLLIILAMNIYFLTVLNLDIDGIFLAHIIGQATFIILVIPYTIKRIRIKIEWQALKGMIMFSIPLIFASTSSIILTISDRYVLRFFAGFNDVGIYTLGFKIGNFIKIFVIQSVMLAVSPVIYKVMNDIDRDQFYVRLMRYLTLIILYMVLVLSMFAQEIIQILAQKPEYYSAYQIVPIICFGVLFGLMRDISVIGLSLSKSTRILAFITICAALFNIALNIGLVILFKSIGAAVATLISQILILVLVYKASQKIVFIPYDLVPLFKAIIIGVFFVVPAYLNFNMPLGYQVSIKLFLLILFPVILYKFNIIKRSELIIVGEEFQRIIKRDKNN